MDKPDQEEGEVLYAALGNAKFRLHQLGVNLRLQNTTLVGVPGHNNILAYLSRGQKERDQLSGAALTREHTVAKQHVVALQKAVEDYTRRVDEYNESVTESAAEGDVAG